MSELLFQAENLSVSFGGIRAVQDLSFSVEQGEVFSIIGPNGAGKTTVFNLFSRLYDLDQGRMIFAGDDISGLAPHQIAERGIARTFQNTELFEQETVLNNLLIGRHIHRSTRLMAELLFLPRVRRQELEFRKQVEDVIDLLNLQPYREQVIGNLPYGVRKMVEVARALCLEPKLLLLDEPFSGIDPIAVYEVQKILRKLRERRMGILITDHNVRETLKIVDRAYIIHKGDVRCEGEAEFLVNDPTAREIYLGPEFNL